MRFTILDRARSCVELALVFTAGWVTTRNREARDLRDALEQSRLEVAHLHDRVFALEQERDRYEKRLWPTVHRLEKFVLYHGHETLDRVVEAWDDDGELDWLDPPEKVDELLGRLK